MARTGRTADETLIKISRACEINKILGGLVVTPWNLDELLPWDVQDSILSMNRELPEMKEMVNEQTQVAAQWRSKNGYRNYKK